MSTIAAQLAVLALVLGVLAALLGAPAPPDTPPAAAEISWWRADLHASPHTPPGFFHLRGGTERRYPILGRSADAQWIALRIDLLNPGYAWTPLNRLALNVAVDDLPVLIATGAEVLSVDPDGGLGATYAATAQFEDWQWRDDNTIVGSNAQGLWHWQPLSGGLRRFADPQWVAFSPDGRYAASGFAGDAAAGDWVRDVVITPVDGGAPMVFANANLFRFTHHAGDPSLSWSPDSRRLLSAYHALADHADDGAWRGYLILGVDGSRVELATSGWAVWREDGTLRIRGGGRDGRDAVYQADGAFLREVEAQRDTLDPASAPPYPFDQPARNNPPRGWQQRLGASADYALAYWSGPDEPDSPDGAALYLYERGSNMARPLLGIERGDHWHGPDILWSDDQRRFAVSWLEGSVYIVATDTLRVIELLALRGDARYSTLIDWSPDGEQLLIRHSRHTAPEFDRDGIAVFRDLSPYGLPGGWTLAEYLLVDAADGRLRQRFRADGNQCHNGSTAQWSPDGRWLAFGGLVVDCT